MNELQTVCEVNVKAMYNVFNKYKNKKHMLSKKKYIRGLKELAMDGLYIVPHQQKPISLSDSGNQAESESELGQFTPRKSPRRTMKNPVMEYFERIFFLLDFDGCGKISLVDLISGFIDFCDGTEKEKLRVIFNVADSNNDTVLDCEEIMEVYKTIKQNGILVLLALSENSLSIVKDIHQISFELNNDAKLLELLQIHEKGFLFLNLVLFKSSKLINRFCFLIRFRDLGGIHQ